jgi:hypothetical protein
MSNAMIARSWGTFTKALAAFNLVMLMVVVVVLVLTETSWNSCLAEVDQGRLSRSVCNGNLMNGQAAVFFLLTPLWVLGDLAFAVVWLWRRRSAGLRSAPATWVALGLSVFGFITILRLGYLSPLPYLLAASGVAAGFIAAKRSARAGRRDELAVAAVAVGCVAVVVGVAMRLA